MESSRTTSDTIVDTVLHCVLDYGPEDAVEVLLETVIADIERHGFGADEFDALVRLTRRLEHALPFVPAVPVALGRIVDLVAAELPSCSGPMIRKGAPIAARAARTVLEGVLVRRRTMARLAAELICHHDVVYVYGSDIRQTTFVNMAASRLDGRLSVFIGGPSAAAARLADSLGAAARSRSGDVATSLPLSEAADGLVHADHVFVVATGLTPSGSVVVRRGTELFYEASVGFGRPTSVMIDDADLVDTELVQQEHFSVMEPKPAVRCITPFGVLSPEDAVSILRAHGSDA